ncbi:MAG: hypothetical protein Q4E81_07445 [Succinatimonas sp.]|nr:hypothetical protein [Succinatimonas sp.]
MKKLLLTLCLICSFTTIQAQAASITIKNQNLFYQMPDGYCEFNPENQKEGSYWHFFDKALGRSVSLAALIAPCKEVSAVKQGKYDDLSHVIILSFIGVDGKFMKFRLGNLAYTSFISMLKPQDLDKTINRANKRLKPYNVKLQSLMVSEPYVAKDQVSYTGAMNFAYQDQNIGFDFNVASALANKWPVAVALMSRNDKDLDMKRPILAYESIMQDLKGN